MNAPKISPLCKQAEQYYYDFLTDEGHRLIPVEVLDHIEHCPQCLEKVSQLRQVIKSSENHPDSKRYPKLTSVKEMLNLHFAYIGKHVTCNIVSPFLPMMLEPSFDIKVPTPITAHLNMCQQCSNDLETIRNLGLSHSQLCRLSRLFADKPVEPGNGCSKAHSAVLAVLEMNFQKTSPETLKHLSVCPACRKLLYKYRQAALKDNLEREVVQKFPCRDVSYSDIFDYVVPYGIEPTRDQYANFRGPFSSHLRTCPNCLAKVQRLHNTIYQIADRDESTVTTVYHIAESAKLADADKTDELYAGFPIKVEVLQKENQAEYEQMVPSFESAAVKQTARINNIRRFLKSGAAAAAVLLIAASFLMTIPSASGVSINQLYKALEKVKNVYIASFVPGKEGPVQEQWISRTSMIRKVKNENQIVVWDVPNGTTKIKSSDSGLVENLQLSSEMASDVGKAISGSLGLVPFADLSLVPKNAKWSRVTADIQNTPADGVEIYELTWSEKNYDGSTIFRKWRGYLNAKTYLPRKSEYYEKLPGDADFNIKSSKTIEYFSDHKIQEVFSEMNF